MLTMLRPPCQQRGRPVRRAEVGTGNRRSAEDQARQNERAERPAETTEEDPPERPPETRKEGARKGKLDREQQHPNAGADDGAGQKEEEEAGPKKGKGRAKKGQGKPVAEVPA